MSRNQHFLLSPAVSSPPLLPNPSLLQELFLFLAGESGEHHTPSLRIFFCGGAGGGDIRRKRSEQKQPFPRGFCSSASLLSSIWATIQGWVVIKTLPNRAPKSSLQVWRARRKEREKRRNENDFFQAFDPPPEKGCGKRVATRSKLAK